MAKISELIQQHKQETSEWIEQKHESFKSLTAKIEKAVEIATTNERGFLEYLNLQAKLPHYTSTNVFAVMMQRPDATQVKFYDTWKKLGRYVRAGEKGITILKRNVRTGYFDPVSAFDVSQTEGIAPPREPQLKEGSKAMGRALDSLIRGCPVPIEAIERGQPAQYDPERKTIYIRDDLIEEATFQLLTQEIIQAKMHQNQPDYQHQAFEIEAQTASFLICKRFGVNMKPPDVRELLEIYREADTYDVRGHLDTIKDLAEGIGDRVSRDVSPPSRAQNTKELASRAKEEER